MQLLLPRVPVSADALEAPGAVVQRVRHEPELDVVIPGELALEVDPGVGVDVGLLGAGLGCGFHAHPK